MAVLGDAQSDHPDNDGYNAGCGNAAGGKDGLAERLLTRVLVVGQISVIGGVIRVVLDLDWLSTVEATFVGSRFAAIAQDGGILIAFDPKAIIYLAGLIVATTFVVADTGYLIHTDYPGICLLGASG